MPTISTVGLETLLLASEHVPEGTNIYPGPTPQVVAPAIVLRPDDPWIEDGDRFCAYLERYVAIPVVSASTPGDGVAVLYDLIHAIFKAIDEAESGWTWESAGLPVVDETTGTAFLAASVRLKYRNPGEEESSP